MAIIVLTSANGSPGVTTAALGLALAWPRPVVLIDADPTGAMAIPAGYLQGAELPESMALTDLALSEREGRLAEDLPDHLLDLPGSDHVKLLVGAARHTQAGILTTLWGPLAGVLADLEETGQDVIVDAGRLGLEGSPKPLISAADLCLLTVRSSLPAVIGASSWSTSLKESFARHGAPEALGLLVIDPGRPYEAGGVAKALDLPLVAHLPWDQPAARTLSHGDPRPRRLLRRLAPGADLERALQATAQAVQTRILSTRQSLSVAGKQ